MESLLKKSCIKRKLGKEVHQCMCKGVIEAMRVLNASSFGLRIYRKELNACIEECREYSK